ncbi:MAG TPA: hypothetical protein PLC34_16605 [Burkholderiaceae bacterium]|nr:hypothetical protein [Burkholderiaceae bacterium]
MTLNLRLLGLSAALAVASFQAYAVGRLADVTVVDRLSGATLPVHFHQGEYWVAGRPGARYAIAVRNKMGERVLAVTSVDGVNVLNGETAAWGQTGYVFGSYQQYQITGWRKSNSEVAAFEFSVASDSYAERTGRTGHVGVIGVALFRESVPEPVAQAPEVYRRNESDSEKSAARVREAPSALSASPAPSTAAAGQAADRSERMARSMPAPKLGTGHGQREESTVSHTSFARQQSQPNETIRIRYDSRENLVASGVIREPVIRPLMPAPNPFPLSDNVSYVPDPPVRRY